MPLPFWVRGTFPTSVGVLAGFHGWWPILNSVVAEFELASNGLGFSNRGRISNSPLPARRTDPRAGIDFSRRKYIFEHASKGSFN